MATKYLDDLKAIRQQLLINLHSSKDGDAIKDYMKASAWTGEIAVQHPYSNIAYVEIAELPEGVDPATVNPVSAIPATAKDIYEIGWDKDPNYKYVIKDGDYYELQGDPTLDASLWTLGADNETAIEFASKNTVMEMIKANGAIVEKDSGATHLVVSSGKNEDGITVYTIGEDDIASKTELIKDEKVIAAALCDLDERIKQKSVTLDKQSNADSGFFATYILKQNNELVEGSALGKINIPKDFLVKESGIVDYNGTGVTITINGHEYEVQGEHEEGKYMVFIVNAKEGQSEMSQMWVPINELAQTYVGGSGITITEENIVEIKIDEDVNETDEDGNPYLSVSDSGLSFTGLNHEIQARKDVTGVDGDVYLPDTGNTYLSGATSLYDADMKLAEAMEENEEVTAEALCYLKENLDLVSASTVNAVHKIICSGREYTGSTITLNLIDCGEF